MTNEFRKCTIQGCKVYTSYIRINKKWNPVGRYHTVCGIFRKNGTDDEKPKVPDILPEITTMIGNEFETMCSSFMRN